MCVGFGMVLGRGCATELRFGHIRFGGGTRVEERIQCHCTRSELLVNHDTHMHLIFCPSVRWQIKILIKNGS